MTNLYFVRRCVGIVLAVLLVIGLGVFCCDSLLKADEYVPVNEVVTEAADEVIGDITDTDTDINVRTVTLQLSPEEHSVPAAEEIPPEESPAQEAVISEEEVPLASFNKGPNKYLVLASLFVPTLLAAGVVGVVEMKKKKDKFFSFTSL